MGSPPVRVRPSRPQAASPALDLQGGRPDRPGTGVHKRHCLRRHEQRVRLRSRRAYGAGALARDVLLTLRAPRVLLRDSDGCLRPRLHRQCRRHGVRLRGVDRAPALGSTGRDLRVLSAGCLAEDCLRWHLGRLLRGARRGNRRHSLALQRSRLHHRRADGPRRARVLRDVWTMRGRRFAAGEGGAERDLRARCAERKACVEVPRRQVLTRGRRWLADLHRRAQQGLRAHPAGALAEDSAREGARGVRSASASRSASPMPVKGQATYEF